MSAKQQLIKQLKKLKGRDCSSRENARETDAKTTVILNLIYQIGVQKINFTAKERKTVGLLVAGAFRDIQANIERTPSVYKTKLDKCVLIKRSALQFMMDWFGQFPVYDTTLALFLWTAGIMNSMKILNDLIEELSQLSNSNEDWNEGEELRCIPGSHVWWDP
uniref:Uncharacterized protein n=1 Tax=Bracon brevicornis TaxID=1563983 RepID=A0A6V7HPS8_9HYME